MSERRLVNADRGDGLTQLFLGDLPSMAGIVTVVSQPFAQQSLREVTGLPDWMPVAVALAVSGLLAVYKLLVVRRSKARECAICVPIMMLVVFATYATGNNVVYYAKEGFSQPMTSDQAMALKRERDILEEQLKNAQQHIATLRQALDLPTTTDSRRGALAPEPSVWSRLLGVSVAEAQNRGGGGGRGPADRDRDRTADRDRAAERERSERERLKEDLRKFDQQQRELEAQRQSVKPETRPKDKDQPLIKSW